MWQRLWEGKLGKSAKWIWKNIASPLIKCIKWVFTPTHQRNTILRTSWFLLMFSGTSYLLYIGAWNEYNISIDNLSRGDILFCLWIILCLLPLLANFKFKSDKGEMGFEQYVQKEVEENEQNIQRASRQYDNSLIDANTTTQDLNPDDLADDLIRQLHLNRNDGVINDE
ncbi:MAG: hypothetical protein BEN19_04145 [Epulopiscium sp. Nuni2H_MBin003]|nr:MAG: hypothetical protein BEN19_04145 [Epulopiscium sp. Nuni2H_MBin003]